MSVDDRSGDVDGVTLDELPDDELPDDELPDGPPPVGTTGALVVVGTPIGNLGDLSPRAVAALAGADVLYCEDTRHSRKLLSHAGITGVPLRSLHEHNEGDRLDEVVAAVAAAGLAVTVVPGPSAVLAALVASGLATDRFCFEGFLPRSGRDRTERLAAVAAEPRTSVLFEAPGRTGATLRDLADVCGGDRPVAVARELTKLHEEVWRGTLADAAGWAADGLRGEVVLVVAGAPPVAAVEAGDEVLLAALAERTAAGDRTRGAVDRVAAAHGVARRRVYDLALRAKAAAEAVDGAGPDAVDGA